VILDLQQPLWPTQSHQFGQQQQHYQQQVTVENE
jgi:hypothetical protein